MAKHNNDFDQTLRTALHHEEEPPAALQQAVLQQIRQHQPHPVERQIPALLIAVLGAMQMISMVAMVIFFLPSTPVFEWVARNLVGLAGLMIIAGFVLAFWLKRKQKEGVPS